MQLTIHGQHMDLGNALETYITEKMNALNEKYFNRAIGADVSVTKETASVFKVHISMTIGKDIQVQATANEHDVYQAFDMTAEKIGKQLRRHKRRIREHSEKKEAAEFFKAQEYTLEYNLRDEDLEHLTDDEIANQDEALVVAEMTTNIQTMTVSDAAMRLNLSGNNALMFRNAANGGLNMVYRRQDGNIGWVDPAASEERNKSNAA